ncbi:hypothetical protein, partial [Neisseria oralis]|uniref:hypothetical protein n=1 Tax=Neisseria oralis TaxID=1107316 RepID=UPI0027E4A9F8
MKTWLFLLSAFLLHIHQNESQHVGCVQKHRGNCLSDSAKRKHPIISIFIIHLKLGRLKIIFQ